VIVTVSLVVRLGSPVDGRCELALEGSGRAASVVFQDAGRDAIADLIVAVDTLAAGEPAQTVFWDGRLRQELRFVPRQSEVSVEVWREEGELRLLFGAVSTVQAAVTGFWSALRDFAETAREAPPRQQWAHWFPTRRMAVLTRHVTGAEPPARPRPARGHALVTYSLPRPATLEPRLAQLLGRRCSHAELVPAVEVDDRMAAITRLGAAAEDTSVARLADRFWFVSLPCDADDERGNPNASVHRVASTAELEPILDRGYVAQVWGGPYRRRAEAEDHLEGTWDSHDTD
jgi:hypothetical protein